MNGDIIQFGTALGLDESFLKQVNLRGQRTIIERVESIDATGAHGRLLSMVQQFGAYILDALAHQAELSEGTMGDAVTSIARLHGVNPQLGTRLVGAIWEVYRAALGKLALDEPEGEEDGSTESQGPLG